MSFEEDVEIIFKEEPKHKCGDVLRLSYVVLKRTSETGSIDYGNISYCGNCDKFVYVESKPFGKFNESLDLFPEEREFSGVDEVKAFLNMNGLEAIGKL